MVFKIPEDEQARMRPESASASVIIRSNGIEFLSDIPDNVHGSPSETCTERGEYQFVARFKFRTVFVQTQRNGCCRSIACVFDIDQYFLAGDTGTVSHGLDDAEVGLDRKSVV